MIHPHFEADEFLKSHRYKEAYELFKEIPVSKQANSDILLKFGKCLICMNKFDEAYKKFEEALMHDQKCEELYLNLSYTSMRMNEYKRALCEIEKAIDLNSEYILAYAYLGLIKKKLNIDNWQHSMEKALLISRDLINYEDYHGKGIAYEALNRFSEAIEIYKFNTDYYASLINLANLQRKSDKNSSIINLDKVIKELNPDESTAYLIKGIILLEDENKTKEAMEIFKKAISIDPYNYEAFYNTGCALKVLGIKEEAIHYFNNTIKIEPNHVKALNNKGNVLSDMNFKESALKCYESALKIDENYYIAYYNKGLVLRELNRIEDAMLSLNKAISINPDDSEIYLVKALVYIDFKSYEKSLISLDFAIEKSHKGKTEGFFYKGLVLLYLENFPLAKENFDEALNINEKDPVAYANRAKVFIEINDNKKYREDIRCAKDFIEKDYTDGLSKGNSYHISENLKFLIELENIEEKIEDLIVLNINLEKNESWLASIKSKIEHLRDDKKNLIRKIRFEKNTQFKEYGKFDQIKFQVLYQKYQNIYDRISIKKSTFTKNNSNFYNLKILIDAKINEFWLNFKEEKKEIIKEDTDKFMEYFMGFFNTFSNLYIISMIIFSEELIINSEEITETVYSCLCSLMPFEKKFLVQKVKTIDNFFYKKNLRQKLEKYKTSFHDLNHFILIIGKTISKIVINDDVIYKLFMLTENDLKDQESRLINKMEKFFEKIEEKIETRLYGKIFKTPVAKLANLEANKLIENYLSDRFTDNSHLDNLFSQFVINSNFFKINGDFVKNSKNNQNICFIF